MFGDGSVFCAFTKFAFYRLLLLFVVLSHVECVRLMYFITIYRKFDNNILSFFIIFFYAINKIVSFTVIIIKNNFLQLKLENIRKLIVNKFPRAEFFQNYVIFLSNILKFY